MVHMNMLRKKGMSSEEANRVMALLGRSQLSGSMKRMEDSSQISPVKVYCLDDAVAFLKTKTHLEYVQKTIDVLTE